MSRGNNLDELPSRRPLSGRWTLVGTVFLFAGLLGGCYPAQDPAGPPIPNAAPDTRITGQPPNLLESAFSVQFAWTGYDPDGRIVGYEWKLCNIGTDGISVQDTLTVDPATGLELNPWRFTTATDSLFVLTGTMDPEAVDPDDPSFAQTFVFLVRARDNDGTVDRTPAFLGFTARTLLPWAVVDRPAGMSDYLDVQCVPPVAVFGWSGVDPDGPAGVPTHVRYLWKKALYPAAGGDVYLRTRHEFDIHWPELVDLADPAWSDWIPYADDPQERAVTLTGLQSLDEQGRQITYIFVVQARDETGAESVDWVYSENVQNVYVGTGLSPLLMVYEPRFGLVRATGQHVIAHYEVHARIVMDWSWSALADGYGGEIAAYRYGWDLADPEDPEDPAWAVEPGNTPEHLRTTGKVLTAGLHTLTVQAWDLAGWLTRLRIVFDVIPVPDPASQYPLLLVDDVDDHDSQAWPDPSGRPLDQDHLRDDFWLRTLAGPGGVQDFVPCRDIIDTETDELSYRQLVNYRAVLWSGRYAVQNFVWNTFKPRRDGSSPYNWLAAYQELVGNLFMVGERAMNQFIEDAGRSWLLPIIFDTEEEIAYFWWNGGPMPFDLGFGWIISPDGKRIWIGRERYPYKSLGLSVLDHVTPKYHVFGTVGVRSIGQKARNSACVGVKGLIVDPVFRAARAPGDAFPDTIFTDPIFDWLDLNPEWRDRLNPFIWGDDEFYDGNITSRTTPWQPQQCDGQPCLEPMFRMYSRFDWIQDLHVANGDNAWPAPEIPWWELPDRCGHHALGPDGRTRTTGQITGFLSHKTVATKPGGRADVLWGFDPYRFDHTRIRGAIRWVLGEHFGLPRR